MQLKVQTLPKLRPLLAAALLAGAGLAACAPIRAVSGYQAIDHKPQDMKVGMDTKSTVLDQLGSPSAQSTFDTNTWYYITQLSAEVGYHKPHITKRVVVAISFDKESEKVTKVDTLALKDGNQMAYNGRETPTRGRELSWVEQLLGNVGRGALLPTQDQGPGQGGGGGGRPPGQ